MIKIGIIGGGNMGEAILASLRRQYQVSVSEKEAARVAFLKKKYRVKAYDIFSTVRQSDIVLLAVKPQDAGEALQEIRSAWSKNKVLLSIAAGLTTSYLEKALPPGARVIRTMPNLPALIGEGMTAVSQGKFAKLGDLKKAVKLLEHIGQVIVLPEKMLDGVTAISGSGPAYVFLFMECLAKAARELGFDEGTTDQLVRQTFLGSIHLLAQRNENPAALRVKVTSKGGTTQAATEVFMKNNIEAIIVQAVAAAHHRAAQLSLS